MMRCFQLKQQDVWKQIYSSSHLRNVTINASSLPWLTGYGRGFYLNGSIRNDVLRCLNDARRSFVPTVASLRPHTTAAVPNDAEESHSGSQVWPPLIEREHGTSSAAVRPALSGSYTSLPIVDGNVKKGSKRQIWKELSSAPKFSTVDLVNHNFGLNIQAFLNSECQIASFQSCRTFQTLLPEIAPRFGFEFWQTPKGHPYHNYKSLHDLHLVKTPRTLSAKDADTSVLPDLVQKYVTEQAFDTFVEDLKTFSTSGKEQLLDNQAKLLLNACRGNVEALPIIKLLDQQSVSDGDGGRDSWNRFPLRVAFSNSQYNVYVSGTAESKMQITEVLVNLLLDYCDAVHIATKKQSKNYLSFAGREWHPSEYLSRAGRLLGWGAISFNEQKLMTTDPKSSGKYDLWLVSINIASNAWKKTEVVWYGQKPTKALALLTACVAMKTHLDRAHKSGMISREEFQEFASYWGVDPAETLAYSTESKLAHETVKNTLLVADQNLNTMLSTLRDLRDHDFENMPQSQLVNDVWETIPTSSKKWYILEHDRNVDTTQAQLSPVKLTMERSVLPVSQPQFRNKIVNAITDNDIIIIRGATGSGKTTQIPQMVLDECIHADGKAFCNIVCTQPRRVSTVSVAHRVAKERRQNLGHEIGYQVRFDDRSPQVRNGITYMTSGYLLRILEQDPDETCERFSHIILDEVHERDIDTDLIMTALKNLMNSTQPRLSHFPKIILMSATIKPEFFVQYFENRSIKIASVDVPGRMHSVQSTFLNQIWPIVQSKYPAQTTTLLKDQSFKTYITEQTAAATITLTSTFEDEAEKTTTVSGDDVDDEMQAAQSDLKSLYVPVPLLPLLIDHLISRSTAGDILVFLPGLAEIEELELRLTEGEAPHIKFSNTDRYKIFKLHSSLYETNYDVWKPIPPGCRRVVLATNIAETSITLPDIKFVVDTGHARRNQFDQTTQAGNLGVSWISKAESAQRKGRAGRTQPGEYLATFSAAQHNNLPAEASPEMLRTALDQIVLRVEASRAFRSTSAAKESGKSGPGSILNLAPSVPDSANVKAAVQQLQNLHAITRDHKVTAMGKALANFPLPPAAAKSILLGIIFRCMDPLLLVGTIRDDYPLMSHPEKPSAVVAVRRDLAGSSCDDRVADARAFLAFDDAFQRNQLDKVEDMKRRWYVRRDAFLEMVRTCRQTYNVLARVIGSASKWVNDHAGLQLLAETSFPRSSTLLNSNSHKYDLVKALCLSTSGQRILVWHNKNWRSPSYAKVLPAPRSVNHASSRKDMLLQRLRRETGDLLYYTSLRIVPTDKYPWACETSNVSPLMGMLFAESLRLTDDNVLIINDWAHYELKLENNSQMTSMVAAKVILEYRKALDRFITLAMSRIALDPKRLKVVASGEMTEDDFNVFFKETDHPLRKIIVDSVVNILAVDSEARRARAEARRSNAQRDAGEDPTRWELLNELEGKL